MTKFIIEGGKPPSGTITISGSKNAALPILCAALLSNEKIIIDNVPIIGDVKTIISIIKKLGAKVLLKDHTVSISNQKNIASFIDEKLAFQLRASILLAGPILIKTGKVILPHPGGCVIGKRSINTHLDAFKQLGAKIIKKDGSYEIIYQELKNNTITLSEASVTATENIMMAATLIPQEIIIKNAAREPHIIDLAHFLKRMGVRITGEGTKTIRIIGKEKLKSARYQIRPDEIEASSFAIAAAVTKGNIIIKNINLIDLKPLINKFNEIGISYKKGKNSLEILETNQYKSFKIKTAPFPGFPTDLQAPLAVLATQAQGESEIYETMYENRLAYVDELIKMGANIKKISSHKITIVGPTSLKGKNLKSPDLRAGLALVVAALCAKGKTTIENIELIDRGYESLEKKLQIIGARIKRI